MDLILILLISLPLPLPAVISIDPTDLIDPSDPSSSSTCSCIYGVCYESTCYCHNGYTGSDCSINFDECLPGRNPCHNDAVCINDVPEVRCICASGYCGKYCDMEVNECQSNPCFNGAACMDKLNGYECVCPIGYDGVNCQVDLDACHIDLYNTTTNTTRCHNGGTCIDGPRDLYYCLCRYGFTGQFCENVIDPCHSSPCLNGARCIANGHDFKCICPYGWSGQVCQHRLTRCPPDHHHQCKNNGICMFNTSNADQVICYCRPDYYGQYCQFKYNECIPNQCLNGATCLDGVNGYRCQCVKGFAGRFCEVDCGRVLGEGRGHDDHDDVFDGEGNDDSISSLIELCTAALNSTAPESQTANPVPGILNPTPNIHPGPEVQPTTTTTTTIVPGVLNPTPRTEPEIQPGTDPGIKTEPGMQPNPEIETGSHSESPLTYTPDHIPTTNPQAIYAPSFNGQVGSSKLVFKQRRVKRLTSSLSMSIISEHMNGTILHAHTTRYNLWIYLEHGFVIIELNDHTQHNMLYLITKHPIQTNKLYSVHWHIDATKTELWIEESGRKVDSVEMVNGNGTVPCFEYLEFGQPPSITDNESFLKAFKGCIFHITFNNEHLFVKDSIQAHNISECFGDVCKRHNPCRNNGVCVMSDKSVPVASNMMLSDKSVPNSNWHCDCGIGYRGWICEEIYCDDGYCLNGAVCLTHDHHHNTNNNQHFCICQQGFFGNRCQFAHNLTLPSFNLGHTKTASYMKYGLTSYNIDQFFEIRFRFIPIPIEQNQALLMFMVTSDPRPNDQYMSLLYHKRFVYLNIDFGKGVQTLKVSTESNLTEQMVLFGGYRDVVWLLIIPYDHLHNNITPHIHRITTPNTTHHYHTLFVGGVKHWNMHRALHNLTGFKGCIYDIEIRVNRQSDFKSIDNNLIEDMDNVAQCDLDCK